MRPVRCAACFRRDYWSIFTLVRDRSQHRDETGATITAKLLRDKSSRPSPSDEKESAALGAKIQGRSRWTAL
jgi:hypothetical protein